jgi:hypothetical protein
MADKHPNQADGGGKGAPTPSGHDGMGGGESGGGAYKQDNTTTGDNREVEREVKTGRKPD